MASRTFSWWKSATVPGDCVTPSTASSSPETPSLTGLRESDETSCRSPVSSSGPSPSSNQRSVSHSHQDSKSSPGVDQPELEAVGQQPEPVPSAPQKLQEPGIRRASPPSTDLSRASAMTRRAGTVALASA